MTLSLQDAIAEVKRGPFPSLTEVEEVILNAVASGDLIPKADADLAVALAYQRATDALLECSVWCDSQERTDASWHNGVIDARKHHMARILALATADALAEVEALKADRDALLRAAHDNHEADKRAEAAEAEVARLRAALYLADEGCVYVDFYRELADMRGAYNIARAALATPEKDATK